MNKLKKLTILIALTSLVCNGITLCKEPEKTRPKLKIEFHNGPYQISNSSPFRQQSGYRAHGGGYGQPGMFGEEPGMYGGGYGQPRTYSSRRKEADNSESDKTAKDKLILPKYAARMRDNNSPLFHPDCTQPDAILATPSGKNMSDLQKKFVKQKNACDIQYETGNSPLKIKNFKKANLFAVSKEDAQKMASAFMESWQIHKEKEIARCKKQIEEYQSKAAQLKKLYESKKNEFEKLEKALKENAGNNFYSPENIVYSNQKIIEESRQAAKELKSKLVSANIEIDVIKAKLSAATLYQAKTQTSKDANSKVLAKLEEIICEYTIELQGALERQKRLESILQEKTEFYDHFTQFEKAGWSLEKYNSELSLFENRARRSLIFFESMDLSYPKVHDNTATVRPVKF